MHILLKKKVTPKTKRWAIANALVTDVGNLEEFALASFRYFVEIWIVKKMKDYPGLFSEAFRRTSKWKIS